MSLSRSLPFYVATALGAFLLFLAQPLMAKQILPWFGGAPAVWSAALLFFQIGLVAGYLYAHVIRRLPLVWQAWLHVTLLAAAVVTLPILAAPHWKPDGTEVPAWRVIQILTTTVGAPYAVLASTAPLLQEWWRRASGREPYAMYAVSNIGSLAALAAFPFALEPALTIPRQATVWSTAYAVFAVACAMSAWVAARAAGRQEESHDARAPLAGVASGGWLQWLTLSAVGSGLLVATTNQLCQDVAAVPLLWVLPLAVYLGTFVMTFGGVYPALVSRVLLWTGVLAALLVTVFASATPLVAQILAFLVLLGGACLVCHGELVATRPAGGTVTRFYLALSIGGAIGGAFVTLLAPRFFTSFFELPLLVIAALMVSVVRPSGGPRHALQPGALVALWLIPSIALAVAASWMPRTSSSVTATIDARRNFFGVLRVQDHNEDPAQRWRGLYNGRVLHGLQAIDGKPRNTPVSYYGPGTGAALAFEQHSRRLEGKPLRAAVVGLGAGAIAVWSRAGDALRFFELNPDVVEMAQRHFTFLRDAASRPSIVVGDARLSLERELTERRGGPGYDLLVIDAFAGDSVPVHLLTRECFAVYLQAMTPEGVLALHVSNRHLDLRPPIRAAAGEAGRGVVEIRTTGAPPLLRDSEWMLVSKDDAFLARMIASGGTRSPDSPRVVWTDHYSSLLPLLR